MPNLIITEKASSGRATVSPENPSEETMWTVAYTWDDTEVKALVENTVPFVYRGLTLQGYDIDPGEGGGVWDVSVKYARRDAQQREVGQSSYSFDTSGGSEKRTWSRLTSVRAVRNSDVQAGKVAPDFRGAIGVTDDSVEGVDVTVPVFAWTETHYVPSAFVTADYQATLFRLTGSVNNAPWRGFAKGEVKFDGVNGSKKGAEDWELTFKFAASPNAINLVIGGNQDPNDPNNIVVSGKLGWDYLWIRYQDMEDTGPPKRLVKVPMAAYVEQVYPDGDLTELRIGNLAYGF